MKEQYFLFCYDSHYPSGGALDNQGVFDTLEKVKAAYAEYVSNHNCDEYADIAVIKDGRLKVIESGFSSPNRTPRHIEWQEVSE